MLLDMDNLKAINDQEGHRAGDQALVILSSALREIYGDYGMVARIGGDEFLIVSERTDVPLHMNLMQRIHDRIKSASFGPLIDYSYGFDIIDENNTQTLDDILHAVDRKMYEQKHIKQK